MEKMKNFYQIVPNDHYANSYSTWGNKIISNLSSNGIYDKNRIYFSKNETVNALKKMANDCLKKLFENGNGTIKLVDYRDLLTDYFYYKLTYDVDYAKFVQNYIPDLFDIVVYKFDTAESGDYMLKEKYHIKFKNDETELFVIYKLVVDGLKWIEIEIE